MNCWGDVGSMVEDLGGLMQTGAGMQSRRGHAISLGSFGVRWRAGMLLSWLFGLHVRVKVRWEGEKGEM